MKLTIFTTLLVASFALAQDPAATTTTPPAATPAPGAKPKPLAAQDKSFVKNATESMYFLINIAEKTKRQAVSEDVKKLGAKITENLNKAWGEIGTVATAAGETMPTELKGGDKSTATRLAKAEADKFDKMFTEQAGKESKKLSRYLESGSKSAQNPELKAFGEKYAAMVKGYESEAETVEKALSKAK